MINGSFRSKTGVISVAIDDGGTATNVEVSDVGGLRYEFDLIPDSPEVDSVQALYSKLDIEIFQHDRGNNDLYDRLLTNLIAQGGASVIITVGGDPFRFFVQVNDIKLDEIERTIKLSCRPRVDSSAKSIDVFDDIETADNTLLEPFLHNDEFPTETLDCVGPEDWIKYALKQVFLNDDDVIFESCPTGLNLNYHQKNYNSYSGGIPDNMVTTVMVRLDPQIFTDTENAVDGEQVIRYEGGKSFTGGGFSDISPGDLLYVSLEGGRLGTFSELFTVDAIISDNELTVVENVTTLAQRSYSYKHAIEYSTETILTIDSLKELAAMEGSIFGYAFGKNFFINRLQRNQVVSISWDDVVDSDIDPYYNPVGGGFIVQLARTYKDLGNSEKNFGAENLGIWPVISGNYELPLITDAKVQAPNVPNARQRVNLRLAPGYPFFNKVIGQHLESSERFLGKYYIPAIPIYIQDAPQPGSEPQVLPPEQWYEDYKPMLALCRSGLNSYIRSISSNGNNIFIDFTCFYAKSIKPWNLIEFVDGPNTDCPARYKGKLFRPTALEYDFKNDTVNAKAYEILENDIASFSQEFAEDIGAIYGESGTDGSVTVEVNVGTTPPASFDAPFIDSAAFEGGRSISAEWYYGDSPSYFYAQIRINFSTWENVPTDFNSDQNWGTSTDPKEGAWLASQSLVSGDVAQIRIRAGAQGGNEASDWSNEVSVSI